MYTYFGSLVLVHVLLVLLGRMSDNSVNKSHSLDSLPGFVILCIRLGMLAVFLMGLHKTYFEGKEVKEQSVSKMEFLDKFRLFGIVWFCLIPTLVFLTILFPPYWRHQIITIGMLLGQFSSFIALLHLFLSNTVYFKIPEMQGQILFDPSSSGFNTIKMLV
eukprot:TRINITY_DN2531_c0_g2_i1.p1 TRINITY_DN2531_c0_g2~~TRINITY_DN2531_c0_g2_i1.p1  ORF type:complete len:174 (-),score=37.40 TRINITY_DN2531_c0_g2_i1:677-1159(-)